MHRLITTTILCLALAGCGTWLNDTRKGLMAGNAAVNAYDDVAVEVWKDAPTNPEKHKQLGVSLCASLIAQDALIEAWAITTLVDKGIAKESDITPYISNAVVVLDSLEDYLEMAGVNLPVALRVAISALESLVPPVAMPPDAEPLEQCEQVLDERFPSAGVPWGIIVGAGAELVLMVMTFIREQNIPDDMLEQYLRVHLKQGVLWEQP